MKAEIDNPRNGKDCHDHRQLRGAWDTHCLRRSQPDDEFRLRASVGWAIKFMGHCPHGLGELVQRGLERREHQGFSWSPINYKMSVEHLRGGSSGWLISKSAVQQRSRLETYFVDY